MTLWLRKTHKVNTKARDYCLNRWLRSQGNSLELFWLNCHYLYNEIEEESKRSCKIK